MDLKIKPINFKCVPTIAYEGDAGLDLYANIEKVISLSQFTTIKIPLGIAIEIPHKYVGFMFPRSGHASKGISVEIGTIDSGYRGELCAIVTNNTSTPYHIQPYEKIAQLILISKPTIDNLIITDTLSASERGEKGFGSSS
ncbi:MAG: dUTP diphosphatase [Lachnospiraceae bacterium]|nr:dUTP diphosphatase [Lachnospiraceae bacterium]